MKRFFSALLCAAALTGTLAVPAAGAASTDTTLRVGLTVGGASSFATPMLENVSGESTGYTVGTVSGTTFKSAASLASSQLTIRLNDKTPLRCATPRRARCCLRPPRVLSSWRSGRTAV